LVALFDQDIHTLVEHEVEARAILRGIVLLFSRLFHLVHNIEHAGGARSDRILLMLRIEQVVFFLPVGLRDITLFDLDIVAARLSL